MVKKFSKMERGRSKKQTPGTSPNSSDGNKAMGVKGYEPAMPTSKGRSPGKVSEKGSRSKTTKQEPSAFDDSDQETDPEAQKQESSEHAEFVTSDEECRGQIRGIQDGGQDTDEGTNSLNRKQAKKAKQKKKKRDKAAREAAEPQFGKDDQPRRGELSDQDGEKEDSISHVSGGSEYFTGSVASQRSDKSSQRSSGSQKTN